MFTVLPGCVMVEQSPSSRTRDHYLPATRESDGLPVAVKLCARAIPDSSDRARLRYEYELLQELTHTGIVRRLDWKRRVRVGPDSGTAEGYPHSTSICFCRLRCKRESRSRSRSPLRLLQSTPQKSFTKTSSRTMSSSIPTAAKSTSVRLWNRDTAWTYRDAGRVPSTRKERSRICRRTDGAVNQSPDRRSDLYSLEFFYTNYLRGSSVYIH